jgi:hypothetical protein
VVVAPATATATTAAAVTAAATAAAATTTAAPGASVIMNLAANTSAIEKSSVVKGTRANYLDKLTLFILWLFKNDELSSRILSDECLLKLHEAKRIDETARIPSQKHQRAAIKLLLKHLDRKDSTKSPIILEKLDDNPNKSPLDYEIISDYMSTKHKIETVDHKLAKEFQKEVLDITGADTGVIENLIMDQHVDDNGEVRVMIRQEASTYDGIRASIAYLYRESGVLMTTKMDSSLSLYIKGSKRINLLAKQTLGLKICEGKKHMKVDTFRRIATIMFQSEEPSYVFAHLFFLLDWYVICESFVYELSPIFIPSYQLFNDQGI